MENRQKNYLVINIDPSHISRLEIDYSVPFSDQLPKITACGTGNISITTENVARVTPSLACNKIIIMPAADGNNCCTDNPFRDSDPDNHTVATGSLSHTHIVVFEVTTVGIKADFELQALRLYGECEMQIHPGENVTEIINSDEPVNNGNRIGSTSLSTYTVLAAFIMLQQLIGYRPE